VAKEKTNYNTAEAADFLGVSAALVRQDVRTRRHAFPFVRIGRRVVYPVDLLLQWRDRHTHNKTNAGDVK
jgi:hypothetical protein